MFPDELKESVATGEIDEDDGEHHTTYPTALFTWTHQPGLSAMVQCFPPITKQHQPAYQPQNKPSAKSSIDPPWRMVAMNSIAAHTR